MDADRLRRAIDQLIYLPSLRQGSSAGPSPALAAVAAAAKERQRRQGGGGGGAGGAAGSDPVPPPPRPWDREGLFRRAATFKPSTWFAKDAETAGPLRAAARGWTNVGVDLLRCEFCGEKLAAICAIAMSYFKIWAKRLHGGRAELFCNQHYRFAISHALLGLPDNHLCCCP